ncbi:hypothetical protein ACJMK2_019037 [Sinanodonta woodiana]|uniref:HAT C-terminal dimerisation domain-containing protein n=1 Tax=Sinanodonta woodiana TaxID=1069815 RepID=A0ABD3UJ79_SINWO
MSEKLELTVKKKSDLGWSAREAAVRKIANSSDELNELLQYLNEDENEFADTRAKAGNLLKSLLSFDFVCFINFWSEILHKINFVEKRLQSPNMNLRETAAALDALKQDLTNGRDNICAVSVQKGLRLEETGDISTEKRVRLKRRMPGDNSSDAGMSMKDEINRVMKQALDTLSQQLQDHSKRIQYINYLFGFLLDVTSLIGREQESGDVMHHCANFAAVYESDVNGLSLQQDIRDCRMLSRKRKNSEIELPSTPEASLKATIQYGKDVFPNLRTALKILRTMSVSVASCERSFSKLKLIKTYL